MPCFGITQCFNIGIDGNIATQSFTQKTVMRVRIVIT